VDEEVIGIQVTAQEVQEVQEEEIIILRLALEVQELNLHNQAIVVLTVLEIQEDQVLQPTLVAEEEELAAQVKMQAATEEMAA
jgi:hypothetical protein